MIYYTSYRVRRDRKVLRAARKANVLTNLYFWFCLKGASKEIEKRRNFLLTNVDGNDILDKLFQTAEMTGTDSKKKNKKVVDKR